MSWKALRPRDRVLVIGKVGTGKSTHVKTHLAREIAHGRRVVVADYHDEYSRHGRRSDQVRLGPCKLRLTFDDFLSCPEVLDENELSLAVVLPTGSEEETADAFTVLSEQVLDTGDVLFCADEVGLFQEHAHRSLHRLATQSRHANVALMLASQRLVDFPPKVRAQATCLVAHLQSHPADLRALVDLTGSEDFAATVSRLGVGESVTWRDSQPNPTKEVPAP